MWTTTAGVGALCALALTVTACGSSGGGGAASQAVPAKPTATEQAKVTLTIAAPADAATVRASSVNVRGTVQPADAAVQVLGKDAKVRNGEFSAIAALQPGDNSVDVVATAAGAAPATTTVSVTRGKTAKQLAAQHAREERRRRAEAARTRRAASAAAARKRAAAAATVSVPDEVGERLDVAEDDLRSRGLRYSELGGGTFGILVKSNWTVCEIRPGAGASVKKHGRVKLVVDREC